MYPIFQNSPISSRGENSSTFLLHLESLSVPKKQQTKKTRTKKNCFCHFLSFFLAFLKSYTDMSVHQETSASNVNDGGFSSGDQPHHHEVVLEDVGRSLNVVDVTTDLSDGKRGNNHNNDDKNKTEERNPKSKSFYYH